MTQWTNTLATYITEIFAIISLFLVFEAIYLSLTKKERRGWLGTVIIVVGILITLWFVKVFILKPLAIHVACW